MKEKSTMNPVLSPGPEPFRSTGVSIGTDDPARLVPGIDRDSDFTVLSKKGMFLCQ
jgi:hypothetical protein